MNKCVGIFVCVVLALPLSAQDYSVQSLYRQVPLLLNPARTGASPGTALTLAYKRQLAGFDTGPNIQFLSLEQGFSEQRVGLALNLSKDNNGPLGSTMVEGIFAYHINYDNREMGESRNYLSFGIAPSIRQTRLAMQELQGDATDPALALLDDNSIEFNTAFGVFLFSEGLELGVSAYNLILGTEKVLSGTVKRYILPKGTLSLGYQYSLNQAVVLHPFANLTVQFNGEFFTDLNMDGRISINDQSSLELGTGLRYARQWESGFAELLLFTGKFSYGPLSLGYQMNRPLSVKGGTGVGGNVFSLGFSTFPVGGGKPKSIKKPNSWFK